MKRLMVVSLIMLLAVSVTLAAAPNNFGGNGKAWTNDYGNHYVNDNNPDVRMDWDNHHFAVPGQGGHHANSNAAVKAHGDQTLVEPNDTKFN